MKKAELFGEEIAQKIALLAVAPIEGRYASTGEEFNEYFSEYALMKHRVFVEISWLEFFIKNVDNIPALKNSWFNYHDIDKIWEIYENFDLDSAIRVKEIEKEKNHDVKSIEYFIDDELRKRNLKDLVPLVHIGLTSEDINNTSYALMIKEALANVWIPQAEKLITILTYVAKKTKDTVMLGHTHGQKATPVTVGKEFTVFIHRLNYVLDRIKSINIRGKLNGATGCYSALTTTFPNEDWITLSKEFIVYCLDLDFSLVTTQIESHDSIVSLFDEIRHFNNVILDIDVDMWMYIAKEYFRQITIEGEVGSSVMPQKVNPIFFENSEGTSCISNALLTAFSNKLTFSRWQRDLSDSTVQRYIGEALALSLLVIKNLIRGLKRCEVNDAVINNELNNSYEVLAEPIQTMLRKYGIPDAYEQLKELTRGKSITDEDIHNFVSSLDVLSNEDKEILMNLTPSTYSGRASDIVDFI